MPRPLAPAPPGGDTLNTQCPWGITGKGAKRRHTGLPTSQREPRLGDGKWLCNASWERIETCVCDPQLPTHIRTDVGRGHSGQRHGVGGGERDSQKRGVQDRHVYRGWVTLGMAGRNSCLWTDRWTEGGGLTGGGCSRQTDGHQGGRNRPALGQTDRSQGYDRQRGCGEHTALPQNLFPSTCKTPPPLKDPDRLRRGEEPR